MFSTLTDADVDVLSRGVCTILEKQGFYCENRDILEAWRQAGAQVDVEAQVAKFPARLIQEFAAALRAEDKSQWQAVLKAENREIIYSGFLPYGDSAEFKAPKLPVMFHNLSTYFYDDATGETRLGTHPDFVTLIRLGDVLHPDAGVGHALNLAGDTPPELEPLEAALVLLEHSHNPRGVYVHDVRQIPYLEEIEAIFGITDPYWHWMANTCPTSPLKLEHAAAERYVHTIRSGLYPAKLAAMPVAGVNMPVTVGGAIVVISAEFVALWFAARLLQSKKIPLTGMPVLGSMNLTSGNVSFTAFDAALRRLAVCEFIRKWTGIRTAPGPGEWPPAKVPGSYCTLEKAYFAMLAAAFTGCHPEIGVGHIDSGLTISPVQLLMDWDFTRSLRFLEKPAITEDSLGLDAILDVGFGFKDNFLTAPHTIEAMRAATWMPEYLRRDAWTPQAEAALLQANRDKAQALIAQYRKPADRADQLARAREVVAKARRTLCR
ncbi:MAG: hypothetical protein A3K19_01730 [Lentisphaerae bacterium RIFOXYB12_FULL_65_16]|nr:MAG: hypothetical protein A3K18_11765 [Lentisphaerae bacterium RIFOXYA12_64_32]OGV92871.1 MAG: hypothetical protein A3K19_01730 [Lentisphaerae bacterium RIFOXYB12_FULL_65_16]